MSTVGRLTVPDLLGRNTYEVDEVEAHIAIDTAVCATCADKPCIVVCPAQLYAVGPDGAVTFDHAGCLECGTCRVVCVTGGIVRWTYPRGSYGVRYRQG
ncbi:ferredoxin-like protein FixX [mine drainage metagenome]|uniref:Ferredoxin-like protein FixX n=1 Tax=mine drainage metagenome TaxID=410659 RepID=A0A1J5R7W9_9ZZZZ